MKKALSLMLVLVMCLSIVAEYPEIDVDAASTHVYMIGTFPGENSNVSMNIGWHSDYTYTNCYVEYTVKSDTSFANAKKVNGTYDSDDYLWFYNRPITSSTSDGYLTPKFLNWGVTLENLTPNTDYIYRIYDGVSAYSDIHNFKTGGAENFSIIWTSDMHLFPGSAYASRLTDWVGMVDHLETMADYPIGFHLGTGDIVTCGDRYGSWLEAFGQDFTKQYMFANLLGNHDVEDAAMRIAPNYTEFWKSSEYFRIVHNNPKNAYTQTNQLYVKYLNDYGLSQYKDYPADKLIAYDSSNPEKYCTGALEDTNGMNYWFKYGNCLFIMFDYWSFYYSTTDRQRAFDWAAEVIEANKGTYDYLICGEHEYLIHGSGGGNKKYTNYWMPFMDANNVDVFIAGDNHVYLRTGSLYNGSVTSDVLNKGTYIVQAPSLSKGVSSSLYLEGDPSGYIKYQYCYGSATKGGLVLNVTPTGIKFEVACREGSNYRTVDTFTIKKKNREKNVSLGYYTVNTDSLNVRETSNASSQLLTSIPNGTTVEITAADGSWGRVRYNGYTGWCKIGDYGTFVAEATKPTTPTMYPVNAVNDAYTGAAMHAFTPAYGSTIYSSGWSYAYSTTITATRQSNNAYKVTSINSSAGVDKSGTSIPSNGVVFVMSTEYSYASTFTSLFPVGSYFTLDANNKKIYPCSPGEANAPVLINPVLTPTASSGYKISGGLATGVSASTTASSFLAKFENDSSAIKVFSANGTELASTATVGTNCVVKSYDGSGAVYDTATVIVKGDCTGDGLTNSTDLTAMKNAIKNKSSLSGNYLKAVDSNNDQKINSLDYIRAKLLVK